MSDSICPPYHSFQAKMSPGTVMLYHQSLPDCNCAVSLLFSSRFLFSSWCILFSCSNLSWSWRAGGDRSPRNSFLLASYVSCRLIGEGRQEFFMQDLSYNLGRVRAKEQLLKSVLLYSFDQEQATSITNQCYQDVKEQNTHNQCPLCPSSHHSVNFLFHTDRRRKWVEVDITAFLRPLIQSHKKDIHLLINLTCVEDRGAKAGGEEWSVRGPVELHLRSPSLLLYLNDTSELAHQRWLPTRSQGHPRSANEVDILESLAEFKPERRISRSERRRLRRESPYLSTNNAGGKTSTKTVLPDLLPSSDFPTSDCDLYDFRVSFSELKLSHWIIFPHRYNPRYCKGTCPRAVGFIYGSPRHTFFQNMIYHKLDSSVPRPSCVPSEYKPLSVLTLEGDSIAYKELDEMIATRCTCR